jgi:DNA-binding response OmpR family regulator
MLIENDDLTISLIRKIFQDNYELSNCASTEEFYEKFSNIKYDLIIVDVSLNGNKNGLELIKEIKNNTFYMGTPILCLTAHAQTRMRQSAFDSGADYFITKPVSNSVLKEVVASLVK